MSRITIAVAFGAGYVLGARAGRERYRAIKGRATALWQSDTVQEQAAKAQDLAAEQAGKAKDAARDRLPSSLGGRGDAGRSADEGSQNAREVAAAASEPSAGFTGDAMGASQDERELGTVRAPGTQA